MARIVSEQVYDEPLSDDAYSKLSQRLDPCLEARHAIWRRSYVSLDKRRVTCEFDAPDAEAVRDAMRNAGIKFERVWAANVFAIEDYPELLAKLNDAKR